MKTLGLTWSFWGQSQKRVYTFSSEPVAKFHLNCEGCGKVVQNAANDVGQ
jgi:Fe2+ or Zn2+ uptake regulation protein